MSLKRYLALAVVVIGLAVAINLLFPDAVWGAIVGAAALTGLLVFA